MSKPSTQLRSYRKQRQKEGERESEVRSLLQKHGELSRQQLAEEIGGIETGSVCAAVRNMLSRGELVVSGERTDESTKCRQELLKLTGKSVAIPKKVPKSEIIASLRMENEDLRAKLQTINLVLKFIIAKDASVDSVIEHFKPMLERGAR